MTEQDIQKLIDSAKENILAIHPTSVDLEAGNTQDGVRGVWFQIPGAEWNGMPVRSFMPLTNIQGEQLTIDGEWVSLPTPEEGIQKSIDFLEKLRQEDPEKFKDFEDLLLKLKNGDNIDVNISPIDTTPSQDEV